MNLVGWSAAFCESRLDQCEGVLCTRRASAKHAFCAERFVPTDKQHACHLCHSLSVEVSTISSPTCPTITKAGDTVLGVTSPFF